MAAPSLDGRRFAAVANVGGEVGVDTVFEYQERDGEVWATYRRWRGTSWLRCRHPYRDTLDIRYVQLNDSGETSSGYCRSTIHMLHDGRLRLDEKWQWESRPGGGTSVVEELAP